MFDHNHHTLKKICVKIALLFSFACLEMTFIFVIIDVFYAGSSQGMQWKSLELCNNLCGRMKKLLITLDCSSWSKL
jgi:hypothetical protein